MDNISIRYNSQTGKPEWKERGADTYTPFSNITLLGTFTDSATITVPVGTTVGDIIIEYLGIPTSATNAKHSVILYNSVISASTPTKTISGTTLTISNVRASGYIQYDNGGWATQNHYASIKFNVWLKK